MNTNTCKLFDLHQVWKMLSPAPGVKCFHLHKVWQAGFLLTLYQLLQLLRVLLVHPGQEINICGFWNLEVLEKVPMITLPFMAMVSSVATEPSSDWFYVERRVFMTFVWLVPSIVGLVVTDSVFRPHPNLVFQQAKLNHGDGCNNDVSSCNVHGGDDATVMFQL